MIPRLYKKGARCVIISSVLLVLCMLGLYWWSYSAVQLGLTKVIPRKQNISKSADIQLTIVQSHNQPQALTDTQAELRVPEQPHTTPPLQLMTPPVPSTHPHRYLVVLGYHEQLSAATHSMFSLGALALDWKANMVEPFLKNSYLVGLQNVAHLMPHLSHVKASLSLFQIYDNRTINKILHGSSPQVSMYDFNTFITDAPEDITFFYFRPKNVQQQTIDVLKCNFEELLKLKPLCDHIEEELNSERYRRTFKNANFRVKRIFCLYSDQMYRTSQFEQYLPNNTTIIMSEWRGCGLQNCTFDKETDPFSSWKDSFRYGIQAKTLFNPRLKAQHLLHHSSIENYAKRYLSHLGYTGNFISIHVRTERLVKNANKNPVQCLKKLATLFHNMTRKRKHEIKTLVITDVGSKYGTSTCRSGIKCSAAYTQRIMDKLHEFGFKHQWYDPNLLESSDNSGYVSLIEMHMLASASKLVLVGYGGFQAILEHLFISNGHSADDVIHICYSR